ncbi:nuclear transport factor 2 family protein [Halopseudomonas phragmitis]|uniref:nuclear transport factor 2 family protein n=1 Tax=Halopseudomonas phragmitis TaxID=1931241 RepID=UPI001E4963DC|nr:nuclear transport factor 2 family protein [Halopseudomonas phragmitis]
MQRLIRLEDLEAIRTLKHRYLNACDQKDIDAIRDCFAAGEIWIDFGPVGTFSNRDDFIEVYRHMACRPQVVDLHHGANPEITLDGDEWAQARWALYYFNLDADTGLTRQLGGVYLDRYRKTSEGWRIVESVCRLHSVVNGRHLGEHNVE